MSNDIDRFDFETEESPADGGLFDTLDAPGRDRRGSVTPDRTDHFELETGQFRDPDSGEFEPGGPPPDFDTGPNRFRAADGQFKSRPVDHFDEPAEVRLDSLEPEG